MSNIIDISLPIYPGMIEWPGNKPVSVNQVKSISDSSDSNVSEIFLNLHTGTHIDAPLHFVQDGEAVEQISLEKLIGKAYVAEVKTEAVIDASDLEEINLPEGVSRLLLKTNNSLLWQKEHSEFYEDYIALNASAAAWIVKRRIELVGIDYLSIQKYKDSPETHQILLNNKVLILEGLNLSNVKQGMYKLVCLPLSLTGVEGAPARAVLVNEY